MSDIIKFDISTRTAFGEAHLDALNSGTSGAVLKIYSASSTPEEPGDALPEDATLLVTYALADPAGTVTDGVLTFGAIAPAMTVAAGTARFGRLEDSSGVVRGQGDCGGPEDGAAITFNDPVLVAGVMVNVTVASVTF